MITEHRLSQNATGDQKTKVRGIVPWLRNLGIVLFCLGVLFGISMLGLFVYADFEASIFDISIKAENTIRPFSCPILLDSDELGIIRAAAKNSSEERTELSLIGRFSQDSPASIREETYQVISDPHEVKDVEWVISAEDAVNRHLILVKVYQFGRLSIPTRDAGCGVLVYDLPGSVTGGQVVIFFLVLCMIFIIVGRYLWWQFSDSTVGLKPEEAWGIAVLIVAIFGGVLFSYLGYFVLAVGFFYLAMLLVGVLVPHFVFSRLRE